MNKEEFRQQIDANIEMDPYMKTRIEAKTAEILKKKRRTRRSLVTACLAVVVLIGTWALDVPMRLTRTPKPVDDGMVHFANERELKKYLSQVEEPTPGLFSGLMMRKGSGLIEYAVEDSAASESVTGGQFNGAATDVKTSGQFGKTYLQVNGVDEGDILKNDGTYIYFVHDREVRIYDKNKNLVGTILSNDSELDTYGWIQDIYRYDDLLIAIGNRYDDENLAIAEVYDISNMKKIKKVNTFTQSGNYSNSRRIGNMLYMVSNSYLGDHVIYPRVNGEEMTIKDICGCPNPSTKSVMVVSAIDLGKKSMEKRSKAIIGSGTDVYCNQNNMYISTSHYDYKKDKERTTIYKVELGKEPNFVASVTLPGRINNQYSMDEKDGYLRVAVTQFSGDHEVCDLYIYDKELKKVGEVKEIAVDESIKAVRYLGDVAYVITYEQTDPLFCIDLSNPKKPKILGSVKISGFSSTLLPIGNDLLLGIGYHTKYEEYADMEVQEGLKIVLFDTSDKKHPKVLDTKVYKDCFSNAQSSTKDVVVYGDDYLIPMQYANDQGGLLQIAIKDNKINIKTEFISDQMTLAEKATYINNVGYVLSEDVIDSVKLK